MLKKKESNRRAEIIWRYGVISILILAFASLIAYNVVKTTVIDADKWNAKADSVLTRVFFVHPQRGDILADDGTVLATNLKAYDISLDYRSFAPRDSVFIVTLDSLCDSLAHYFPQRSSQEWKQYLATPLAKPRSKRTQCRMLLKAHSYSDYQRILKFPFFNRYKKKYQHGLCANQVDIRLAPYGSMAELSIGRCNKHPEPKFQNDTASKEMVTVLRGYSGLEYALDSLLYGRPGTAKMVALTRKMSTWVDQPAEDGLTLRTTININIQDIVENELSAMLRTTEADWGSCILMEVGTGDIKAISNLERDPKTGRYIEARNRIVDAFEPGSVMKPISMIVALEDGYAFPLDRTMSIGSVYAYAGGSPIHDTHSPAVLPVRQFIEYSSNIGMTKLIAPHYENDLNGFRQRLRELGFFDRYRTGMQGERPPYFPTLHPKAGGRVSLSRMSYGYSTMIPPLYTCAVYNAIASKGKYVRPRLVSEYITRDGQSTPVPISYVRDSICSEKNAQILLDMLHSVVYGQGGTAKSLRNDVVTVVGKTGTCRIAYEATVDSAGNLVRPERSGYKENQYRLAFCGIFPYENPKYTCMVLISNPSPAYKGAATTSGYVVKNVAMKMYAHGMLDKYSDHKAISNPGTTPLLYSSTQDEVNDVRSITGAQQVRKAKDPASHGSGKVPDVIGLDLRQALARIEEAGYELSFRGSGMALAQNPPPGTPAEPGQKVTVTFSHR